MDLELITGEIIPDAKKVLNKTEITTANRLYYELGYYANQERRGKSLVWIDWTRRGIFKEIKDIQDMLKIDKRLDDEEYLNHHNFYIT